MIVAELLTESFVYFTTALAKKFVALAKDKVRGDTVEFDGRTFVCAVTSSRESTWEVKDNDAMYRRTVVRIQHTGHGAGTVEVSNGNTLSVFTVDPKTYLMTKLKIADDSHMAIIKALLLVYKRYTHGGTYGNPTPTKTYMKSLLVAAKQAGYKSPELDAIRKSFDA